LTNRRVGGVICKRVWFTGPVLRWCASECARVRRKTIHPGENRITPSSSGVRPASLIGRVGTPGSIHERSGSERVGRGGAVTSVAKDAIIQRQMCSALRGASRRSLIRAAARWTLARPPTTSVGRHPESSSQQPTWPYIAAVAYCATDLSRSGTWRWRDDDKLYWCLRGSTVHKDAVVIVRS